jgi:uncharacterized membrane protein YidH (DUF202 family)
MALTLTAAGLALVRLADRAVRPRTARVQAVVPVLTASLVVVLGVALAARGLALSA